MPPAPSAPQSAPEDSRRIRWIALLLGLGTLLLFAPVRTFQFVNFDDDVFVHDNEHVRQGFTWAGVKWAFSSADIDYWRPLSWLSHMLDVELFGLNPGGHHVTSVLIHALNAVVLFLALRALTGRLWPAAFVAALFAWHPLHVESVAWIAERKDVLCALFWFLGLWAYAEHARAPSGKRLALVAACFGLGLMSKPMILTFPFLLLVLDVWPLRRAEFTGDWRAFAARLRVLVWEKLPLFILVAVAAAATFHAQREVGAMEAEGARSFGARLANALVAYVRYVGLTFWPADLAILHPLPRAWAAWQVGGAAALLAGFTWWCVRRLAREPWLATGWFWFLGTLVPVIGVVQVGAQAIASRYTYIPLVGLFLALVWLADDMVRRRRVGGFGLWCCAIVVLGLCGFGTRRALAHWRDGLTIFEQAVRVTRDNHVAMTNLGNNLARAGDHQQAIDLYQQALRIFPNSVEAHYNLASSLGDTGQPQAAERHYREALRLQPKHARAHNNLANLLADTGRVPEAIEHYEASLRHQPGNLEARFNYGVTLADAGRPAEAIAQFEAAVRLRPGFTRARLQLVNLLTSTGNLPAAAAHNAELLRHDPASPEGRFNAGSLAAARGDWPVAVSHWQAALQAKPDFHLALHRLAWTSATHPNPAFRNGKAARELAGRFAQIAGPRHPEALDLLAVAHAADGAFAEAAAHARQALAALGTNQPAFAAEVRARLALFEAGRPYVEGPAK
jgi:protein O-mannosyl-transferase